MLEGNGFMFHWGPVLRWDAYDLWGKKKLCPNFLGYWREVITEVIQESIDPDALSLLFGASDQSITLSRNQRQFLLYGLLTAKWLILKFCRKIRLGLGAALGGGSWRDQDVSCFWFPHISFFLASVLFHFISQYNIVLNLLEKRGEH